MCITSSVHRLLAAAGIAAAVTLASDANAQTAFTYQGVLEESGEPLTTTTMLRFALFDAPTGGSPLSGLFVQSVDIEDGVFTATPNFGPVNLAGVPEVWLEISVETSSGAFETLGRQRLTATPFALNTRGITVLPSNDVGIGTTNPLRRFHLDADGTPVLDSALQSQSEFVFSGQDSVLELVSDGSGLVGSTIQFREVDGSGASVDNWQIERRTTNGGGALRMRYNGGDQFTILPNGNAGLGTTNPARRLHLRGPNGFMLVERDNNPAGVILRTFDDDTYTTETSEWRMLSGNDGNFQLQNANNGFTLPFVVTPTDRVGIGTDSPTNLLEISGDSNPGVVINNTTEDTQWSIRALNNTSRLGFYDSFAGHDIVEINSGGIPRMLMRGPNDDLVADIGVSNNRSDAGRVSVRLGNNSQLIDFMADGTAFMLTDTYLTNSDARLKENIKTIADPIATVAALRGVTYDRIDIDSSDEVGFIAQEVEQVLPQLVNTNSEGMKSVSYDRMTALLVEAVKAQQAEIDLLKSQRSVVGASTVWPVLLGGGVLGGLALARRRMTKAASED